MYTKQQELIIKMVFSLIGGDTHITGYSVAKSLGIAPAVVYSNIKKIKNKEV